MDAVRLLVDHTLAPSGCSRPDSPATRARAGTPLAALWFDPMKSPLIPLPLLPASLALLVSCGGATHPELASLTLEPTAFSLAVGETVQLTGTLRDGAGNPVSGATVAWTTGAATVAQVNSSGIVP